MLFITVVCVGFYYIYASSLTLHSLCTKSSYTALRHNWLLMVVWIFLKSLWVQCKGKFLNISCYVCGYYKKCSEMCFVYHNE